MTLDECAQLLGVISGIEPRFRRPDPLVTATWHQIVQRVPLDVACRAVATYYGDEADRVIMPADITRHARKEAGGTLPYHRSARENVAAIEARIEAERPELVDREEARRALAAYRAGVAS